MVAYIKSDLEFILKQIKIAEAHAAYTQGVSTGDPLNPAKPLFGADGSIPTYNLSWGLRTVDGTYNNPLHPEWGAADNEFPEHLGTHYRTVMVDPDGPGGSPPVPVTYTPGVDNDGLGSADPSDVFDPTVRTISNLIVDQTLGNPSAILTALQRAGIVAPEDQMAVTAQISAAFEPIEPLFEALTAAEVEAAAAAAAAAANPGNSALADAAQEAEAARAAAELALTNARDALDTLLEANGVELDGANVVITNTAPDEGLSAPFNSWFTLFGQFFDHGLDLVAKGGSGTVFIPLLPDDPLYVEGSDTNFMVLTRATTAGPGADGVMGTADDTDRPVNTTTSFVDQNQTYSSHPSHQVFLRAYEMNTAGDPVATGKLIEGGNGGMATWADLKAQAADLLGIQLTDSNVGNVPLLATDQYGEFIRGPNGFPQLVTSAGLIEGNPAANGGLGVLVDDPSHVPPYTSMRTGHAFLADIAHNAVPTGLADGDIEIGLGNPDNSPTDDQYDNELLDAHYVAGDGRANENIGLTAVHHVFHSEHNRLVEHTKEVVLSEAQALADAGASDAESVAFLNEWLAVDVTELPANLSTLVWDGERLFQAAKFGTEMQYQHLVFEEFARKIQPNINVFLVPDGYDVTIDPSIVAEFAHVVYRFGHSMLTESIDRFDPSFNADHIGLIEGFLNPIQFETNGTNATVDADISAGAIIRGMTRQAGNEIDEFVTSALRNNLLGLPLDLATINLARGRDTGVPSLNEARAQFYEATAENSLLKPYESWVDFAGHLKNEASIINFIAAYGTHSLITGQDTIEGKRDAALTLITGISVGGLEVQADAVDFLNATGAYAGGSLGGLNDVDLWIGGLAEEIMPFGGMLGSTFNFVFETQMESLQNGDRFYYLQRLDGLHLFGEMEGNSFAAMIMRNTDATHLPSDVFSTPGLILEVDQSRQFNDLNGDGTLESTDPVGGGILTPLVIRNNPATPGSDSNYLRYTGDEHVVLGGTEAGDIITASIGDDTIFGDEGNDRLEGGFGNDIINGGAGDDIIRDSGGDDNIKANEGHDVVHAGPGLDLVMGGTGQDFIVLGTDMGSEVFAGEGNDFILGNKNAERILGNEGDDWIETGTFDGAPGDNFDEIFAHDGIDGNDVFLGDGGFDEFIGEGGDDIMVGSAGRGKMAGMSGFDWATYKDNTSGVNADLSIPIIFDEAPTLPQNASLDEFESMEGLSGSAFNDILAGTNDVAADRAPLSAGGTTGYLGSGLDAQGIALINGLQAVLGAGVTSFLAGDIILGGDGSDQIRGNAGDDIIDGDKWLNVRISIRETAGPDGGTGAELYGATNIKSMTSAVTIDGVTKPLTTWMLEGKINPGQLQVVREVLTADGAGDTDIAVFADDFENYDIVANSDGSIQVTHVTVSDGLESDGSDRISNIETLRFRDQDYSLVKPVVQLHTQNLGSYLEAFDTASYTGTDTGGTTPWTTSWTETNDTGGPTGGDIEINGGRLRFDENIGGGELITRSVNLTGATAATLQFNYEDDSVGGNGENLVVEAWNGTIWQAIGTLGGSTGNGNGTFSASLSAAQIGGHSQIRFRAEGNWDDGENFYIDNVRVSFTTPVVPPVANYATTYVENAVGVAIASGPSITDDGPTLVSARIVLTNAKPGDDFDWGTMPAGIQAAMDSSVVGRLTVNLTGTATLAAYQAAIQAVTFDSSSDNPGAEPRIIHVTVNDGFIESNPAVTTITVNVTNDPPVGNGDSVYTNFGSGQSFSIPEWALLANDSDPEGAALNINGATVTSGSLTSATVSPDSVNVTDNATAGGTFNYTVTDGSLSDTTNSVQVTRDNTGNLTGNAQANIIVGNTANSTIEGQGGDDIILAGAGVDQIIGGLGNDRILGEGGNDTIVWNANSSGETDGFDIVDGGLGTGTSPSTDTFDVNTRTGTSEAYRVYTRAAAEAAGIAIVGATTEIVITRQVGATTSIIAELDNIEEIRIGTQASDPSNGSAGPGDTVQIFGDFSTTSLALNTITIDGNAGDDTIDISSLNSAHRIVFRSNGGHDTLIGNLRPEDVIELPGGTTLDDYTSTTTNGVTTLTNGTHSITYTATGGAPQITDEETEPTTTPPTTPSPTTPPPTTPPPAETPTTTAIVGTAAADPLFGTSAGEAIMGLGGRDVIFARGGDDDVLGGDDTDMTYGDAGNDRLLGENGDDFLNGGAGNDTVFGGSGGDLIVAEAGDGDDTYYGDDMIGGTGIDTLDMSAITANITADLGTGFMGRGSVSSSQTGSDAIWGIENIVTGFGNDVIIANSSANIMDGGTGNDTYRFQAAADANGDTIASFQPGDKIDLSPMDAISGTGNQSFMLVTGSAFTGAGQVLVTHESRADGDYTVIQGNTDSDDAAEFTVSVKGNHELTNNDFNL